SARAPTSTNTAATTTTIAAPTRNISAARCSRWWAAPSPGFSTTTPRKSSPAPARKERASSSTAPIIFTTSTRGRSSGSLMNGSSSSQTETARFISRRLRLACARLVLSAVAGFGCDQSFAAQAPAKVAVGYATISNSSLALWLAQDEKIFAKHGIDADLVFMPGAPALIAAINSGALAVGFTGGTAILAAAAGGADFKVLAASHVRSNHDLIVKPEIKRPEDLRGKRIGVTSIGGTGWMAAMLVFEQLGIIPDREKIIISAFGEMRVISRALETGTIDGALVTGNFTSQFKRAGYGVLGE